MKILITGGASGLGESITRKLATELPNQIYFTYSKSVTSAQAIEKKHPNATAIKCDFKNMDEVNELAGNLSTLNIDVLINNAYSGDFLKAHFNKIDVPDFLESFTHNILPTITLTQSAIAIFRKKKFGKIITVLSAALVNTPPIGSAVYVANKSYLQGLSKVWATENIKYNITSNTISPSFMLTAFTKNMDERLIDQIIEKHPLNKLLETDEVAESVSFLVNATQQINGIDLVVNAGANFK